MATQNAYPLAPSIWPNLNEWCRKIAEVANSVREGKINATGTITLTTSTSVTTLINPYLAPDSVLVLDPLTQNAASEYASGVIYVLEANRSSSAWVITHSLGATTDRIFRYAVLGG